MTSILTPRPLASRDRHAYAPTAGIAAAAAIAALHLALAVLYQTEEWNGAGAAGAAGLGPAQFLWLAIAAAARARRRRCRCPLIVALVAVSLFKFSVLWTALSFLRRPDHRSRHRSRICWRSFRSCVHRPLAASSCHPVVVLLWLIDPWRVRSARCGGTALAGMFAAVAGAVARGRRIRRPGEPFQGVNHISNFVRPACDRSRPTSSRTAWFEADAPVAGWPGWRRQEACRPAGQAAAHHLAARRVELRHHAPRPASRCRMATATISARSTARRARSWSKAPAGRPGTPSTTCSPAFRRARSDASSSSSRASPPAGSSAACRARCSAAVIARSRSIRVRRASWARAASRRRPASSASSIRTRWAPPTISSPTASISTTPLHTIAQERAKGAPLFIFVYVTANHFPWTRPFRPGVSRPRTGARPRQRCPRSTEYPPPGDERARLPRFRCAPEAGFPDEPVLDRAVRRSPAGASASCIIDPALDGDGSRAALRPTICATSPPITPSTR